MAPIRPSRTVRRTGTVARAAAVLLLAGTASLVSAPAKATAIAHGSAGIDWSTLAISGNVTFDPATLFSAVAVDAFGGGLFAGDTDDSADWGDTSAAAPVAGTSGSGSTTPGTVVAHASARAVGPDGLGSATVLTDRGGVFDVNADGDVTFTVMYTLSVDARTDLAGERAFVNMGIVVQLDEDQTPCCLGGDAASITDTVLDGDDLMTSTTGTLSVTAFFTQGQRGRIVFEAFANNTASAVSEPAALALGLGAFGLAGLSRARRAR